MRDRAAIHMEDTFHTNGSMTAADGGCTRITDSRNGTPVEIADTAAIHINSASYHINRRTAGDQTARNRYGLVCCGTCKRMRAVRAVAVTDI